jgi:hypothetical protein
MKNPVSRLLLIGVALILCAPVCFSQQGTVPTGWQKINAQGFFTFALPKSAWDTGFTSLEDYYKEYRIGKLRFMFNHRPMGHLSYDRREKSFGKGFQEQVIEISGRKAYLYSYTQIIRGRKRYFVDLYVGDHPNGDVELVMQADSWRLKDLEIGRKIFGTVEFLKSPTNHR